MKRVAENGQHTGRSKKQRPSAVNIGETPLAGNPPPLSTPSQSSTAQLFAADVGTSRPDAGRRPPLPTPSASSKGKETRREHRPIWAEMRAAVSRLPNHLPHSLHIIADESSSSTLEECESSLQNFGKLSLPDGRSELGH